ncbi:MAG: dTMP kinase [Pseudomonadota bacterium]
MFITFEGIDGSGKSSQALLLQERLKERNHATHLTREPGGSDGAEAIRHLLVTGDQTRWSPETEILLFTAARRDHVEKTVRPALKRNEVVICDRYADSTRVYQGATRGDLRNTVDLLHREMIGLEPDLTLVIDVDPEIALTRGLARQSGEDRFEDFGLEFQKKLRAGFLSLASEAAERVHLIDGDGSLEAVAARVWTLVEARIYG